MKKINRSLILLLWCVLPLLVQAQVCRKGLDAITAGEMKKHLEYLASDAQRGRDTPSPELDTCAAYIADYFKALGLKPVGDNQSYFQHFNLLRNRLSEPNAFILTGSGIETEYKIKDDYVPLYLTANRRITAPVVFAGYGITAPEFGYDDYKGINVRGKIVFVFTHEPQENDSTSRFDGRQMTDHSKIIHKALNAREHGAVGLILITDPVNHRFRRPPNTWPSLMRNAPEDAVPLEVEEKMENKIVAVRIGKALGEALLQPCGKTMESLQTAIDSNLKPQSFELSGVTVTMQTTLKAELLPTQNVVGLIEGSDPVLKDEIVVYGAHYDHLGARSDSVIYNGADDNASGTVGVMICAKAFAACTPKPKRSILFCTWAGEEKGLLGSRYYVDTAPIFPLEKTVTNINMDMIGRNDSSSVEIAGYVSSDQIEEVTETVNAGSGLTLNQKGSGISGTDFVSFYRKKIPVLGFFTGLHTDYHKPSDTADKCFPEGMAQIARLAFKVGWTIANTQERPQYKEPEE